MKIIKDNIISLAEEGRFDVIIHGCNCFNNMNEGLAREFKAHFPEVYLADQKTGCGDRSKLGDFSYATITRMGHEFVIVNAYTQYEYLGSGNVDYAALQNVLDKISAHYRGQRIASSLIGTGRGGGDRALIEKIFAKHTSQMDFTLVYNHL